MNQYPDDQSASSPADAWQDIPVSSSKSLLVMLVLVIVVGLGLTGAGFRYAVHLDEVSVTEQLQEGTEALLTIVNPPVAFPNPVLDELFSTLERIREDAGPDVIISRDFLDGYLWDEPMLGLDTSSIEYLPGISQVELQEKTSLVSRFGNTVAEDFTVFQERDGVVEPASPQERYFPLLIESGYADYGETPGLDLSINNPIIRIAMDKARDSADFIAYSFFPVIGAGSQTMVSRYFYALYDSVEVPETVEERRQSLRGFVSVASFYPTEAFAGFFPESYQGVEASYFPAAGSNLAGEGDPWIISEMAKGFLLETPYNLITDNNAPWVAITRATPDAIAGHVTNNRWWVLAMGILITVWLAGMIFRYRQQATKVHNLVLERTHDLAERTAKLAEVNAALKQSEALYRMLAENVSDVIYTLAADGTCTYVSPSVTQQSGFAVADYIGFPLTSYLTPDSAEKIQLSLDRVRRLSPAEIKAHENLDVIECEILCRDGASKPVENKISLILDDSGQLNGFLFVSRDISERRKSEAEKRELEDAYHHSQKMEAIGTLAGGIAHDFNNLLTVILGHAELLKMSQAGKEDVIEELTVIENATLRGKDLTGQLLGFARKGRYQELAINLNESITEIRTLLDRTADKRIEIRCAMSDQPPVVIGDPGQLDQLILNLAVNALDAMPDGGVLDMATGIEDIAPGRDKQLDIQPGRYAYVEVRDTGKGIPGDVMSHIFEPFFTDKEDGIHIGMGLAMAYGVAKNHGGAIQVQSEVGKGSAFRVYLPFAEINTSDQADNDEPGAMLDKEGTILVVDDESMVREMASTMLNTMGYRVQLAGDGIEAVNFYTENWQDIDLVIVDMIMPNMNGIDCLHELKAINPDVKVIIATGYSQDSLAEDMVQEKISGFLQKPFRMKELSTLVESVIH